MTTRRSFMAGIFSAAMAPAFVGSSVLMPVRKIITVESELDRLIRETTIRLNAEAIETWKKAELDLKNYVDDQQQRLIGRGLTRPIFILDYPGYVGLK